MTALTIALNATQLAACAAATCILPTPDQTIAAKAALEGSPPPVTPPTEPTVTANPPPRRYSDTFNFHFMNPKSYKENAHNWLSQNLGPIGPDAAWNLTEGVYHNGGQWQYQLADGATGPSVNATDVHLILQQYAILGLPSLIGGGTLKNKYIMPVEDATTISLYIADPKGIVRLKVGPGPAGMKPYRFLVKLAK